MSEGEHHRGVLEAITDTVKNAAHLAVSAVVSMERAILPEFDVGNDTPAESRESDSKSEGKSASDDVPTSETWWTPTWTKEDKTWVPKAQEPQQMSTFEDVVSPQAKGVIANIKETLFGEQQQSVSPNTKKLRDQLFAEIREQGPVHSRKQLFAELRKKRTTQLHNKLFSEIRDRKTNQARKALFAEIRERKGFNLSSEIKQQRALLFSEILQRKMFASPNTQRLRTALFNEIIERKPVEPASPHTKKLREELFKEIRQRKQLEPEEIEKVHEIVERAQHDKKFMEAVLLAEDPLKLANKDVHKNLPQPHLPRIRENITDTLRR